MKNYKLKLHTVAIRTLFLLGLMQILFINTVAGVGNFVSVTATSGTTGPSTYSTLYAAFTAINAGTHKGAIEIAISGTVTETSSAVLNGTGSGSASYTSVLIYPTVTNVIIGGNLSPSTLPIIDLNGATNVTIDGRVNHTGSSTDLVIRNAYSSGNSTIRFINGASSNTVKYCTLKGAGASAGSGIIFFSTSSTSGNSNNIIDHNSIQFNGYGAIPQNCIFALGSSGYENSGNQITNNNIYDFSNPAFDAQGIFISSYNTTYTITGNSLYQKTSFVPTGYTAADVAYTAIKINIANGNGNNFTISNNYIGGSAAQCGGTAWTKSNSKNNVFKAISIATASGTASSIQGNTISNFSWTNSSNAYWYGIIVEDGTTDVNIGTTTANTIGATTGTGSITLTNGATDGKFFGINFVKGTCSGNRIGSITTASVAATDATLLFGIFKSGAASATISNNIIGRTDSVSINANSAASSNTQEVYGIYLNGSSTSATLYVTGNTIANLNNATTNASSAFAGIYCSDLSTSSTVSGNFISRLSASGSGTTATVYGIKIGAGATTYSNNIISLGGNTLSKIYGFYESGAASNNNTLYFNTVDIEGTPASGSNPSYALYIAMPQRIREFSKTIFLQITVLPPGAATFIMPLI